MEKNIIVTDSSGRRIGLTYPKRAHGMVKNNRAEFISENEIRLLAAPMTEASSVKSTREETKMSDQEKNTTASAVSEDKHKLFFNAREWSICSDVSSSKAERTFVTDFEGNLSEAYCIGDKTQTVTEIATKQLILEKNTRYTLYFWTKIDKSIKNEAVCQLQIVYNGDFENKRVYVLSNNNIRPAKIIDGWQLYEIPFVTEDNEYTQLRFSVKSAVCSVIPGKEAACYASLPDDDCIYNDGAADSSEDFDECSADDQANPFKNISDSFKEFFGQFDPQKRTNDEQGKTAYSENKDNRTNDPFASLNEFARQIKRDVQREVNRNIRNDVYSDIRAMKDEIVNELKNTFGNNNK